MTEYIVLRTSDSDLLRFLGIVEASGPEAACKALGNTEAALHAHVAVPKRNWSQVMVGQEQVEPRVVAREVTPTFPEVTGQATIDEALDPEALAEATGGDVILDDGGVPVGATVPGDES